MLLKIIIFQYRWSWSQYLTSPYILLLALYFGVHVLFMPQYMNKLPGFTLPFTVCLSSPRSLVVASQHHKYCVSFCDFASLYLLQNIQVLMISFSRHWIARRFGVGNWIINELTRILRRDCAKTVDFVSPSICFQWVCNFATSPSAAQTTNDKMIAFVHCATVKSPLGFGWMASLTDILMTLI